MLKCASRMQPDQKPLADGGVQHLVLHGSSKPTLSADCTSLFEKSRSNPSWVRRKSGGLRHSFRFWSPIGAIRVWTDWRIWRWRAYVYSLFQEHLHPDWKPNRHICILGASCRCCARAGCRRRGSTPRPSPVGEGRASETVDVSLRRPRPTL